MANTREYEWNDVSLNIGGRNIIGFRALSVNEKQEKEILYAKGNHGHSIQNGNITVDGSITLLQSEIQAIRAANGGTLTNVRNATIVWSYGNPSEGIPVRVKTITGVSFTEDNESWSQGDKFQEIEVPYLALKVVNS